MRCSHIFQETGIRHNGRSIKTAAHHRLLHKLRKRHVHYRTCVFCGMSRRKVHFNFETIGIPS